MTSKQEWPKQRLGEVADLCLGKMLDKKKNRGELHPYLGNIHVRWGRFDLDDLPEMRFEEHEHDRYGLKRGDLIVCEGGEPGRCALWNDQVPNMKIQKALHRVRPHSCLDSRYLLYWFLWAGQRSYFDQFFTGATIKHLPGEKLAKVEIDVPDLPTQRKIAGILSAYDDLIENNLRRIRILEEMAQSLYREWFVHFRFPGHESTPMVDSPLGPIPEGWEVKKLEDVTTEIIDYRGKTPKKLGGDWSTEGIRALSALNVKTGYLAKLDQSKFVNEDLFEKWMKVKLQRHDILLTSEAPLGEAYLLPDDTPYCLSQRLFALRANESFISAPFLYRTLVSSQTQSLLQHRATGTTVKGIRQAALREVSVVIPAPGVLSQIKQTFANFEENLANLRRSNQTLRQTRDMLLPKLIRGQ